MSLGQDAAENGNVVADHTVTDFSFNPILNSPYEYPGQRRDMDEHNQSTAKINEFLRPSSLKSPIAAAVRRYGNVSQGDLFAESEDGVEYETNEFINSIRAEIDKWRKLPQDMSC